MIHDMNASVNETFRCPQNVDGKPKSYLFKVLIGVHLLRFVGGRLGEWIDSKGSNSNGLLRAAQAIAKLESSLWRVKIWTTRWNFKTKLNNLNFVKPKLNVLKRLFNKKRRLKRLFVAQEIQDKLFYKFNLDSTVTILSQTIKLFQTVQQSKAL